MMSNILIRSNWKGPCPKVRPDDAHVTKITVFVPSRTCALRKVVSSIHRYPLAPRPFDDAHVVNEPFVDGEFQHRSNVVEPGFARSSGVEVKAAPLRVAFQKKNVAVTTHKNVGALRLQLGQDATRISRWTPPDVRHPYLHSFNLKSLMFRPSLADFRAVDVAVNRATPSDVFQCVRHGQISNVSGMPNFIRPLKLSEKVVVHVPMGVGQQRNVHAHREVVFSACKVGQK